MKNSSISARSAAKTFAVSTVAVCTTELVLDGGLAEGSIVRGNFSQTDQTTGFSVSIPGGFGDFSTSDAGAAINAFGGGLFNWSYARATLEIAQTAAGSSNDALFLSEGGSIGAGLIFGDLGVMGGDFDGYVGMRFVAAGGADFHYGWARVIQDDAAGTISILDYAYENTPGVAIQAGAIPEASSLALLALGAGGLAMHRRRHRKST